MSPSFVYNQIGNRECQGAIIPNAMKVMSQYGDVPLKNFGYTDQSCSREPDQATPFSPHSGPQLFII